MLQQPRSLCLRHNQAREAHFYVSRQVCVPSYISPVTSYISEEKSGSYDEVAIRCLDRRWQVSLDFTMRCRVSLTAERSFNLESMRLSLPICV